MSDDLNQMSGSALRSKLEETLEANRQLQTEITSLKAGTFIQEKGLTHLKPGDLAGVSESEWEDTAVQLEQSRAAETDARLRQTLAQKGLSDDQIAELIGEGESVGSSAGGDEDALRRAQAASSIQGRPLPRDVEASKGLRGFDAILAGMKG